MDKVTIVEAGGDLRAGLRAAMEGQGGISAFVRQGSRVLIKPNFNTADPFPGSSDPAAVEALADLCHEAGASEVTVADSSTYMADTTRVMTELGIFDLVKTRPWLRVVNLDREAWVEREIPGGRFLKRVSVPEILDKVDTVIFLACLKTHFQAKYTGALKLAVGTMRSQERIMLHVRRIQEKIADLCIAVRPALTVVDARKCFIKGGPMRGEVREPGLILASRDRVALDIEGIRIIQRYEGNSLAGIAPEDLPQVRRAMEAGVDKA